MCREILFDLIDFLFIKYNIFFAFVFYGFLKETILKGISIKEVTLVYYFYIN